MCGSMEDVQSPTAEIRREKKKEERMKIVITRQKYNGLPYLHRATIMMSDDSEWECMKVQQRNRKRLNEHLPWS